MSASVSVLGGVRDPVHLRDVLAGTLSCVFPAPEFLLPAVGNAFSPENNMKEEAVATRLNAYIGSYLGWVRTRVA
jgi:chromate reductase